MKSPAYCSLLVSLVLVAVGCSSGDRSTPAGPSAAQRTPAVAVAAPSGGGGDMPVGAQGAKPAGFDAQIRVRPTPDAEGIVRGESPLTVEFDLCSSKGEALSYAFDWDFDHKVDRSATGDGCLQQHTYRARADSAEKDVPFEANVCVISGAPATPSAPGTYYSCRRVQIRVAREAGTFPHDNGAGQLWRDNVPTGTYTVTQALRACQEYIDATPGSGSCQSNCSCGASMCIYNSIGTYAWFYTGAFTGRNGFTCEGPGGHWE